MIICLTKQVKALESIKNNLGRNRDETFKFYNSNKYRCSNKESKENKESECINFLERQSIDLRFEESYITSIPKKQINLNLGCKKDNCRFELEKDYDFSEEFDYAEKIINHLKRNRKKYKLAVMLLATTINFGVFGATTSFALEGASLGYKLYSKGVEICKIICILGFMVEGGRCLLSGTVESLWKVAIRYITFILAIRYLPDVVDWFFSK